MGKKLIGAIILLFGIFSPAVSALTISGSQDCDANAIIRCGLNDSANMTTSYQNSGVANAYTCFGISQQDINSFDGDAVAGRVTSTGKVTVNGKTVATNAMTAGRQNIAGSTAISCGGQTFYKRPPSVSFQSASLPAYVVMRNNQFAYAIIASCGNPVMATPVTTVTPKVKAAVTPPPAQPVQTPAPAEQSQTQTQTQTVNVTQSAPASSPTSAPAAPAAAPAKVLPNTGPGNIVGLSGISAVLGTIGHFIYSRRKIA
jgi:hypothetical protein